MHKRMKSLSTLTVIGLVAVALLGISKVVHPQMSYAFGPSAPVIVLDSMAPVIVGPRAARNMYGVVMPNLTPVTMSPNWVEMQAAAAPQELPRTSDNLVVRRESSSRLFVQWQGEPRAVRRVTFGTFDKNRQILDRQVITSMPAEAYLNLTSKTIGCGVRIEYLNGATNDFVLLF